MERRALVAFFVFLFVGLPGYSQPCLSIDHSSFDFGEVMDGAVVEHTFLLKNVGDMTLKIFRVAYNCSCTTYEIPKTEIAPGESVPLTVCFTTTGYSALPQPISQTVTIYSNDPANPHEIALQGRVLATQTAAAIELTAGGPLLPIPTASCFTLSVLPRRLCNGRTLALINLRNGYTHSVCPSVLIEGGQICD